MGFLDNLDKDLNDKLAVAINKCDPKLVQILLGPGGCQLWQYWLIRAIFNYDMLSMFKVAKCEFPLSIAEKQLKALEGKSHIDNKQLQNIQEQEKESFLERIRVFYDCERKLQIQGQEHAQLEASAFTGGVLQQYEKKNMDCQTSIFLYQFITFFRFDTVYLTLPDLIKLLRFLWVFSILLELLYGFSKILSTEPR